MLSCEAYFLNYPRILENANLQKELFKEPSMRLLVDLWNRLELTFTGIGVMSEKSRLYHLSSEEMKKEIHAQDIQCDLNALFFDSKGNYVPLYERNKLAISKDLFFNVPTKVVIGYGRYKAAIDAALKSGAIDILFTDRETVNEIEKERW